MAYKKSSIRFLMGDVWVLHSVSLDAQPENVSPITVTVMALLDSLKEEAEIVAIFLSKSRNKKSLSADRFLSFLFYPRCDSSS
jgi:hypothetical protein